MKTNLLVLAFCQLLLSAPVLCQGVGIGTTTPNSKAILEMKSTDKGVLFPRLTTGQRNAITNPPNGLHIYNTDEACLNYFDSLFGMWNCYCDNDSCKVIVFRITADIDSVNFYDKFAKNYPNTKKFVLVINSGVTIKGGFRTNGIGPAYRPPIDFTSLPGTASVKVINNGNIYGTGGPGGGGATGDGTAHGTCADLTSAAANGGTGADAIQTKTGVKLTIDNYGLIAGGAGGGGGGGRTSVGQFGGGGGGGASFGFGATAGGYQQLQCYPIIGCTVCAHNSIAQSGSPGQLTTGGAGGNGASGGGNGGAGGALGQTGQNGTGTNAGLGGGVGKAIGGGSGNVLSNMNAGQSYGSVD